MSSMASGNQTRTVNEIFDRYEREVFPDLGHRTQRGYRGAITNLRTEFGSKIASTLIAADFHEFMSVATGKAHRNKMLTVFSTILSIAVKQWHWLDHNVVPSVPRLNESRSRVRHFSDEDFDGVLATASPSIQQVMKLCMLTGRSQADLVTLKWSQVHEKTNEILFRHSITREKIIVKITPAISSVLDDCRARAGRSAYVINTSVRSGSVKRYTDDGFRAMWQRTMREWQSAGHNRFTFHDIRSNALEKLHGTRGAPKNTGSVIPLGLATTRRYLDKVTLQLNASYDAQLYDCCAVMCRRLVETLIIEVYESCGRAAEIKLADGNFLMLNGLVNFFENDTAFNVGRKGMKGLRDFKTLGDLAAHSRRFNAQKEDIDLVRDGLRVIVEELVHLAKLAPSESN
jgi:integrase